MNVFLGVLAGLVWGTVCGLLNLRILKKALRKNDANVLMAANLGRMAVDLLALLLVFLLRGVLPFSFEAMLVSTAVALSILTLVFALRFGKKK